jgi:post-segregation antitoxin (ccd killing protein)
MDITVYLPDDLGKWAKDHDLPLSRMLREAVDNERRRRQAVAKTLGRAEATDLTVQDDEGNAYTARLHGTLIAEVEEGGGTLVEVYLGEDGAIYVYFDPDSKLHQGVTVDELRNWLPDPAAYAKAMRALGEEVVIDLGLPG